MLSKDNCEFCFFHHCNGRCNPQQGTWHKGAKSSGPLEPFDPELSALARKHLGDVRELVERVEIKWGAPKEATQDAD